MSEEKGKPRNIQEVMPSTEEVQHELARAKSMDDFFGKEGIFRTSHIAPVAQYLDHKSKRSPVFIALLSGVHNMLMIRCIIQLHMATTKEAMNIVSCFILFRLPHIFNVSLLHCQLDFRLFALFSG